MFSVCRFLLQCAIERGRIKRPRIWQNMFFSLWLLREYLAMQLAMNFWGWGRKGENFWPVENKDYTSNMLVPRTHFHARENFSVVKIEYFCWCCCVWKRKTEEMDVGRKKSGMCEYGLGWPGRGYPRNPGTPGSSTTGARMLPIPSLPEISLGKMSCHGGDLCVFLNWGHEKGHRQMADVRVHLPFRLYLPFSHMRTHCVFVVNCVS